MGTFKQKVERTLSALALQNAQMANDLKAARLSRIHNENASALEKNFKQFMAGGGLEAYQTNLALETIVLTVGRPVLPILENETVIAFNEVESEFWRKKLSSASEFITHACKAVGRIELKNHATYDWVGTGWVVYEGIVVTNRHVAEVFAREKNGSLTFRPGLGGNEISASVDFLKEFNNPRTEVVNIDKILFLADQDGPDIALLKLEVTAKPHPRPILLADKVFPIGSEIAAIGYPAKDSRIPDQKLMEKIFGDVFDRKRLAPGTITGFTDNEVHHDCSTLGGNSGSVLMDLHTGHAVGLHFAGAFLERNYAVSASVIKEKLNLILNKTCPDHQATLNDVQKDFVEHSLNNIHYSTAGVSISIPVKISVSLGIPTTLINGPSSSSDIEPIFLEGKFEDYADRIGYQEQFLGDNFKVPLPFFTDKALEEDLLTYDGGKSILPYMHFSVAMSRSRRLCRFSAVNIDGNSSIGAKRLSWRIDPRIPKEFQIINECYGESPKFSRGHMTRREDPIWGSIADATVGNSDSMHVTNTVPQMQTLNGVIWLALENYALQNARKDKMKISVLTGPVLADDDPERYGVKIPVRFWKIIVFIHDITKKLCATGYMMSQETHLRNEEFIFGSHNEEQVSIKEIEKITGLSFNNLSASDPLNRLNEMPFKLTDPSQILYT